MNDHDLSFGCKLLMTTEPINTSANGRWFDET
ncbi:uncharacterized protein G2W53_042926 [Senna tora]|uniref:Uncharacterized protein n=1 Tax=Senna tora TaxID=362788 RepID=A0A834SG49_9FABA|nr:uncharacterized protein G2W53_042926 [Senna tora]